jgi:hypothetical protein
MPTAAKRSLPALLVAALLCLVAACSSTPGGVLSKEKMAAVLADLYYADAVVNGSPDRAFENENARLLLKQRILQRHGITQADLDSSFHWYAGNSMKLLEVYDLTDSILNDSLYALGARTDAGRKLLAGDTTNVWTLPATRLFNSRMASDFLTFSIAADSTWHRGDVLRWSGQLSGADHPLTMVMMAEYRGGVTEVSHSRPFTDDGAVSVELYLDSTRTVVRVCGYAQMESSANTYAVLDSITLNRNHPDDPATVRQMRRQLSRIYR